jgi:hypothetical protein
MAGARRIADHLINRIRELRPWNLFPVSPAKVRRHDSQSHLNRNRVHNPAIVDRIQNGRGTARMTWSNSAPLKSVKTAFAGRLPFEESFSGDPDDFGAGVETGSDLIAGESRGRETIIPADGKSKIPPIVLPSHLAAKVGKMAY